MSVLAPRFGFGIGLGKGYGARSQGGGGEPLGPTTATISAGATPGALIAAITGLATGEEISTVTPNDGRLALDGTRRNLMVGLTAITAGNIAATLTTSAGRVLAMDIVAEAGGITPPAGWVPTRKLLATGTSLTARGFRTTSATAMQAFWDGWLNALYFLSKGRFDWYMRRVAVGDANYQRGLWGFSFAVDSSLLDADNAGAPVTDYTGGSWTNPGIFARVEAMRTANADIHLIEGGTIDNAGSASAQQILDRFTKIIDNGVATGILTGRSGKAAVIETIPPRSSVGYPGLSTTFAQGDVRRQTVKDSNGLLKALADARDNVLLSDAFGAYANPPDDEPYLADIRAAAENWLSSRMVDDGLHTATDGAFARARRALPIINALCPPPADLDTSAYNASSNPTGAINSSTARMSGTTGTMTSSPLITGQVASGYALTRTAATPAVVATLSKRAHPTIAGTEVQVIRLQSDGTGTGNETFALDRQSNWTAPAVNSEIQAYCDLRVVSGSRAIREISLDLATRLSSGIQQQSIFGSSKASTSFNSPYGDYFGPGLVYMPDLTGEDGRLTSYALPVDANTAGVRGKFSMVVDATRVFDIEVEVGPWTVNPRTSPY